MIDCSALNHSKKNHYALKFIHLIHLFLPLVLSLLFFQRLTRIKYTREMKTDLFTVTSENGGG